MALDDQVIFDCTIAEAREAAAKGCSLYFCIIGDRPIDLKEVHFLTASVSESYTSFGSIEMEIALADSVFTKKDEKSFRVRPLGKDLSFEAITLSGMYDKICSLTRHSFIDR